MSTFPANSPLVRTGSVVATLASTIQALKNCVESGNTEWEDKHRARIARIVADYLPSGSGVDNGTTLELDKCTRSKLVMSCGFHHMDESGGYDGWTEHTVIVTPEFDGFAVDVKGRNRNDIKEYLADIFHSAMSEQVRD
jgi:hypothetical protein